DMSKITDPAAREEYTRRAIELVGCFYMRCTDHLPLVPDVGNFLFGGSSSDQAITLGGLTPDGKSAVNDMTYIFLKVTEMLSIRDPNVNARFAPGVNSDAYLKRLCEVNLITTATPSMHNDNAVMASLAEFNYPAEHLRNWSATGCVEPTISGRHIGHTNCMMMNMVAALEMALNDGRHPVMDWDLGPKTGGLRDGDFPTFDSFLAAFEAQYKFLIDNACEYNNMLGRAHSVVRPTPLLSAFIEGCVESGRDATKGGAMYNSSGAACIGLADVTDSLMAVKKLVYDEKRFTFRELRRAVETNFKNDTALLAHIMNKVPKFGSGDPEALEMAARVAKFSHDCFGSHTNFRGGRYTAGFWSMSNHVAFGCLSGALPSGRLAGKPFTPGLTPAPAASDNLLDPIRDVASLNPEHMNNNIAFNVKIVPGAQDSHARAVDNIFSYVKTYFDLGGMQMQLNVVTSAILRDAMKNPENYRNLLVRISGYNAYFVTLNRDMQLELIERAEYNV
ncbi:MAG: pyruvate formate lyase family protein, partial [bacterium]